MASVTFTPSSVAQLYFLSDNTDSITRQVAYLLPRTTPTQPAFGLQQSWQQYSGGCYIFLAKAVDTNPAAERTFAQAAWNILEDPSNQGTRFAWFSDPTNPSQGLANVSLAVSTPDNITYQTTKVTSFSLRNFQVIIGGNCQVAIGTDNCSFTFTRPADQPANLAFQVNFDDGTSTALNDIGAGLAPALSIPLCGPQGGTLQFALTLHNDAQTTHFDLLDIGLRLFYQDQSFPASDSFFVASQRYPVFSASEQTSLTLWANLDPLAPLESTRTFFAFAAPNTQETSAAAIPTHYRTNLGHKVALMPASDAKLVMAIKTVASVESGNEALYLVPHGTFVVSTATQASAKVINLMCGMSGVEYIKLAANSVGSVQFIAGRGAFAPSFIPGQPPTSANASDGLKALAGTAAATTAWAYVTADVHSPLPVYAAQPEKSVLHQPAASAGNSYLEYMEVPSAHLTPQPPAMPPYAFPLLPYAGLTEALSLSLQLEREVISPTRRYHISQLAPPPSSPFKALADAQTGPLGATPQGLRAEFNSDFTAYTSLTLATSKPYSNPLTGETLPQQQLQLHNIANTDPLWAALQTNQLFLVMSDPAKISTYFGADHQIAIENWIFDLLPASPNRQAIILLKFYDKPLWELVSNSGQWSMPTSFNSSVTSVQQQITAIMLDAASKANPSANNLAAWQQLLQALGPQHIPATPPISPPPQTQAAYQKFVDVLLDPAWNGILILNCSVPPNDLPGDLKGLSVGITANNFFAHHLGIEISPVKHDATGAVSIGYSALFGLIDYNDLAPATLNNSGYNYKMLNLRILFENARVRNFSSQIQLTLDALFGESTKLLNSSIGNILLLDGRYESHNGVSAYIFSFNGDNIFNLPSSQVLNAVEILKAQVSTTLPAQAVQAGDVVQVRFSLWCNISFKALKEGDVLSFGNDSGVQGGLAAANLGVNMSFKWQMGDPSFAFDAAHVTFDLDHSTFRAKSLYGHFPLKLTGMVAGLSDKTPADLGYMSVSSPLNATSLSYPWYGLVYELDLGSVGALAGKVGLTFGMIVAWSPNPNNYQVYLGLKLPGSSSGKTEITLQGVLKITFQRVVMIINDPGDGALNYVLLLKNIKLKFLVLSLPPTGQTEIVIFGNSATTNAATKNTLGWYAAYAKQAVQQKPPPPDPFSGG